MDINWCNRYLTRLAQAQRQASRVSPGRRGVSFNNIVQEMTTDEDEEDEEIPATTAKRKKRKAKAQGDTDVTLFAAISKNMNAAGVTQGQLIKWVDSADITPKNLRSLYSAEQWKERTAHIEANGLYKDKPHLFSKDALNGKKVCIACKRVNHTADECKACEHGSFLPGLEPRRKEIRATKKRLGNTTFGQKLSSAIKKGKRGGFGGKRG